MNLASSPEELGKTLRALREERGVTLEFMANKSKISPQTLRALEDGAFEKLPPFIFSRMFLRQYLTIIGEDPASWLTDFERLWKKWEDASQPFVVVSVNETQSKRWGVWTLGVLLVLVAFGALVWLHRGSEGPFLPSQATPLALVEKLAPTPVPSPQVELPSTPIPSDHLVVESTSRPCWVEWLVAGKAEIRRLLPPGERIVVASPAQEGELILGDAGAVTVRYGSTELAPVGKDGQVVRLRWGASGLIQENKP